MSKILEHNAITNEVNLREMTEDESQQREIDESKAIAEDLQLQNAVKLAKETAAAKAALLEKLGITEDEAKLLLS